MAVHDLPQRLPAVSGAGTPDRREGDGTTATRRQRERGSPPRARGDARGAAGRRGPWSGRAETLVVEQPLMHGFTNDVIRIHPRRVVAWNLDGPGPNIRDVR